MRSRRAFAWGAIAVLVAFVACSSAGTSGTPPGKPSTPTSSVIGMSGGKVASSDGALEVTIPPGALSGDLTITVAPTASPAAGSIGNVYEIGPSGTTFMAPVTMTIHYAGVDLGGHSAADLRVATAASNAWQLLVGFKEDTGAQTVSGTTTHLSPYGLVFAAGAQLCIHSGGAVACAGGGGGPCVATTCAGSSPCQAIPGTTLQSCTDTANGYDATCCFPAGEPACFQQVAPSSCTSGGCAAPLKCASGDPCQARPGATVKSCVDEQDGFTATCCYPPGVAPPDPVMSDGGAMAVPDAGGSCKAEPINCCAGCMVSCGVGVPTCIQGTYGLEGSTCTCPKAASCTCM